jgi:hypothetical protein
LSIFFPFLNSNEITLLKKELHTLAYPPVSMAAEQSIPIESAEEKIEKDQDIIPARVESKEEDASRGSQSSAEATGFAKQIGQFGLLKSPLSPLGDAISKGASFEKLRSLIQDQKFDPNKAYVQRSPESTLHLAIETRYLDAIDVLLENEAHINARDAQGKTILFIAVEQDNFSLVKLLLKAGADTSLTDNIGRLPMSIAKSESIKELLKKQDMHQYSYGM